MEIRDSVKTFLTDEVPLVRSSGGVDVNSSLMASGLLDSIDVIKLVSFLEQSYGITIEAEDVEAGHLETIGAIEKFVRSRAGSAGSRDSLPNLCDAIALVAKRHPRSRAIVAGRVSLSYGDLMQRVDELSESLHDTGVEPGERVAIVLPNGPEFVIAALAIWKAGAVAAPFHPRSQGDELTRYLNDCRVKVLLSDNQMATLVEGLRSGSPGIRSAILYSNETAEWSAMAVGDGLQAVPPADHVDPGAAVTQYSTGSTGRSKRITRTHQQLLDECTTAASVLQITENDRILVAVPLCHAYGFVSAMIPVFLSGATFYTVKDFFVRDVVRLIERERITGFPGVPLMYQQLAEFSGQADLSSLRSARTTGAPMMADTARLVMEKYGVAVYQQYGSTETGMISINLDAGFATSVGVAIPGVVIQIVDESKKLVDPGTVGKVAVKSSFAPSRYDGDAGESDSYFEAGVFYPGDLGTLDDSGRLELRGRTRRFVNVAGNKVDPGEIEQLLKGHPAVSDAIVVGASDGAGGQKVKALVVLKSPSTERELFDYCMSKVADFKCPRVIEFRNEIPRNEMGKIVRKEFVDE